MTILASATALAMAIALFFELRRDLMMLQQNESQPKFPIYYGYFHVPLCASLYLTES